MSLDAHISHICRTAYIAIRQISSIRKYLTLQATKILICAFVLSRLDYCNSLLSGCSQYHIEKLQKIQNSAARLVTRTRKRDHITPILHSLHWLPIRARIEYKLLVLGHNFFSGSCPLYLSSCLSVYSPARTLRSSSDSRVLVKPSVRTKSFGERTFSFCAPSVWNSLPHHIRYIDSLPAFKRAVKTFVNTTHLSLRCDSWLPPPWLNCDRKIDFVLKLWYSCLDIIQYLIVISYYCKEFLTQVINVNTKFQF